MDDGAAQHLAGGTLPHLVLPSTTGESADLADLAEGILVLYCYPLTRRPGEPPPEGWNETPGARGCTPQACAFRDAFADLDALGAHVYGLSSQPLDEQRELVSRVGLPYPLLSDPEFVLAGEPLRLPTFEFEGSRYFSRLTLIAREGTIVKIFYPVFPPDRNAADVVAWLRDHPRP